MQTVSSSLGRSLALWTSLALVGCGSNVVGTGPDAGTNGGADQGVVEGYPPGPYGINEGDVIQNMTFSGFVNASPDDGVVDQSGFEQTVSLSDFRDMGYRYLLFNVAAIWCVSCQVEATAFPGKFRDWAPKGGYLLSILIEDAQMNPATTTHLDQWVRMYQPNYTMLHDPQGTVQDVLAPPNLPVNVMIELSTMKIIRIRNGDDPEFFQFFEERLDQ